MNSMKVVTYVLSVFVCVTSAIAGKAPSAPANSANANSTNAQAKEKGTVPVAGDTDPHKNERGKGHLKAKGKGHQGAVSPVE